jgi:hypothetical protein
VRSPSWTFKLGEISSKLGASLDEDEKKYGRKFIERKNDIEAGNLSVVAFV